jgi:hypothetical protein
MLHNVSLPFEAPGSPSPAAAGRRHGFGFCPACGRPITLDDDFARVALSLYHLGCLFGALRSLGDDSSLRAGVEALGASTNSGRLAAHSPARAVGAAEPADGH